MILKEGGNVFKDMKGQILTQRINQTDVAPTLAWLDMMLPGLDLQNNTLGSTGKNPHLVIWILQWMLAKSAKNNWPID